jgi:3-hydroxybutyrate dehydrogenase
MFALLTTSEYPAGTILEVCDETKWRVVSLLNDPGPQGPASQTSRKSEAVRDIMRYLKLDGQDDVLTGMKVSTD